MGTDKRARQKELHKTRAEEARKAASAAARRKRIVNISLIVVLVAAAMGGLSLLSGNGNESAQSTTTTAPSGATTTTIAGETTVPADTAQPAVLTGPGQGASITGKTPCPESDGSSKRTTAFAQEPPTCIDDTKTYTAKFVTTKGEFAVVLDAKAAPKTVNNFVVLARYHYYDGIPFHRIVPNFVIQAGDPSDTPAGNGGPGYTIAEEPPADKTYEKYELAMAKTSEPKSTGSQFFVVTGDPAPLNDAGTYSLFGKVLAGNDVVDAIGASPTAGPSNDSPTEQITITSVEIVEG